MIISISFLPFVMKLFEHYTLYIYLRNHSNHTMPTELLFILMFYAEKNASNKCMLISIKTYVTQRTILFVLSLLIAWKPEATDINYYLKHIFQHSWWYGKK